MLPSLAVAFFFVWFEMVFRAATPFLEPASTADATGWLLVAQADVAWISALAVAVVCALGHVAALTLRPRGKRPGGSAAAGAPVGEGRSFPCSHALRCGVGGVLMALGSAVVTLSEASSWEAAAGGALAGAGMALLVGFWLPAAARSSVEEVLLVVILSVAESALLTTLVVLFDDVVAVAVLVGSPVAGAACALGAMRLNLKAARSGVASGSGPAGSAARAEGPAADDGETVRSRFLNPQTVVALVSLASSYLVLGIVGISMDMTLGSAVYWYMNLAGVINLLLLVAVLLVSDTDRLQSILMLAVSTAIAAMPLSLAFLGETFCFVLTKVAGFCSCGLVMLIVAQEGPARRGDEVGARPWLLLACAASAMGLGLMAGDALRRSVGTEHVGEVLPLVAVLLLYVVFVLYILFVAGGTKKILHVITGSFTDEAELARIRRDVIVQGCPEISVRESDVLLLLLRNYTTSRIAEELCISENTAKTHVRHLYAKLGVNSRSRLLALAEQTPYEPAGRRGSDGGEA